LINFKGSMAGVLVNLPKPTKKVGYHSRMRKSYGNNA
jgi:hypothetical protein